MKRRKKTHGMRWIVRMMFLWFISLFVITMITFSPSCAIFPKKSPESYIESGKRYVDKKDYPKAYRSYTRAIKLNHDLFIAYWERANVEIKMDSLEKAIDDMGVYIEYMRTKSGDADKKLLEKAYMQRADIMLKKGYKADACSDFNDACQLNISNYPCEQVRLHCK